MGGTVHLVVMNDDFGHCEAVNEGVVSSFSDGLLTDTNLQATCSAFREACALTRQHGIPVGLHCTLSCDWDLVRWKPLTAGRSLAGDDGYMLNSVTDAWKKADLDEAEAELRAQWAAVDGEGLSMTHLGEHMGVDDTGRAAEVMGRIAVDKRLPHKGHWCKRPDGYQGRRMPHYAFKSCFSSGPWRIDPAARKERLKERLRSLEPGHHMWVVHVAVDHPSLNDLCSPDWHAAKWARQVRVADYALTMDPEIKDLIEELGIKPMPISECPIDWAVRGSA